VGQRLRRLWDGGHTHISKSHKEQWHLWDKHRWYLYKWGKGYGDYEMEATHILASHTRSSDTCETSIDDIYISGGKGNGDYEMEATHILASHTRSSDTWETSIDDISGGKGFGDYEMEATHILANYTGSSDTWETSIGWYLYKWGQRLRTAILARPRTVMLENYARCSHTQRATKAIGRVDDTYVGVKAMDGHNRKLHVVQSHTVQSSHVRNRHSWWYESRGKD